MVISLPFLKIVLSQNSLTFLETPIFLRMLQKCKVNPRIVSYRRRHQFNSSVRKTRKYASIRYLLFRQKLKRLKLENGFKIYYRPAVPERSKMSLFPERRGKSIVARGRCLGNLFFQSFLSIFSLCMRALCRVTVENPFVLLLLYPCEIILHAAGEW